MKIMAVFAHPDDEIGCVSSLAKHVARGDQVMLVWLTYGEHASLFEGVAEAEVKRIRAGHGQKIAELVGAEHRFFDFGDTRLQGSRDEALELARFYCWFKPDAVLTWDDFNRHPDHRATAKIAFDAITLARIPKVVQADGHENLSAHRENLNFYQYVAAESNRPVVHVDVSEHAHVGAETLGFFAQFYGWKITKEEWLETRAGLGRRVGVKYAEKFTVQRSEHFALEYLR